MIPRIHKNRNVTSPMIGYKRSVWVRPTFDTEHPGFGKFQYSINSALQPILWYIILFGQLYSITLLH